MTMIFHGHCGTRNSAMRNLFMYILENAVYFQDGSTGRKLSRHAKWRKYFTLLRVPTRNNYIFLALRLL